MIEISKMTSLLANINNYLKCRKPANEFNQYCLITFTKNSDEILLIKSSLFLPVTEGSK